MDVLGRQMALAMWKAMAAHHLQTHVSCTREQALEGVAQAVSEAGVDVVSPESAYDIIEAAAAKIMAMD